MKKGCFITLVIVLFILIAGAIYLYRFHKKEFVNFGKETIISLVKSELKDEFEKVKNSPEKDSLSNLTFRYIEKLKNSDIEEKSDEIDKVTNLIKESLRDSIITARELEKIRETIKNYE